MFTCNADNADTIGVSTLDSREALAFSFSSFHFTLLRKQRDEEEER